jgi:CelD/BcsL family acetyltransferase involved in cellulose biosynthesis
MGNLRLHVAEMERALPASRQGGEALRAAIEPGFDFRSTEYRELHEASVATAFQQPLWLDSFYRHLAPARGADKLPVTLRAGNSLVAVLPMIRRVKSGVALVEAADLGVGDYAAPVVRSDWMPGPDVAERVAAALPSFDLMRIRPIREEHVVQWQALLGGEPRTLDFSAHAVELGGSFEEWRTRALEPGFLKQLDRKKKRFLKEPGATLRLLRKWREIKTAVVAMQTLRAGRFDGDPIQQDFAREFYAQVAVEGAEAGFSRTYALTLGGEDIGYVFGLTWKGRLHYLLIGCDYEKHGRHSPGLLMYDGIIEDWMKDVGTVFDFTIGDEAFKADFGTTPTPMFEIRRAATWRGRLGAAAFDAREQLKKWGTKG